RRHSGSGEPIEDSDMGGVGIPVSQMTNRQLIIAIPLVFVISAVNMFLFAFAFAMEWSGDRRFFELLGSALVIVFFVVFLAYGEPAYIRELLKRRRIGTLGNDNLKSQ